MKIGYRVRSRKERMLAATSGYAFIIGATAASSGTITMPTSTPKAPPLRKGETVRVQVEGILNNRVGQVSGFMETGKGRLALVSWPDGGWTTFSEEVLERTAKGKKK